MTRAILLYDDFDGKKREEALGRKLSKARFKPKRFCTQTRCAYRDSIPRCNRTSSERARSLHEVRRLRLHACPDAVCGPRRSFEFDWCAEKYMRSGRRSTLGVVCVRSSMSSDISSVRSPHSSIPDDVVIGDAASSDDGRSRS